MGHLLSCGSLELCRAIAVALDLDPDKHPIMSITLEASARSLATVTVKMAFTVEQDSKIAAVVKKYGINAEPVETITTWRDKEPLL